MFRKKEKTKIENESKCKKVVTDFILPLYLNQRFVYDILAMKNDGFTEFFEIKDKTENIDGQDSGIKASLGTNNNFALIQAELEGEINTKTSKGSNNEKSYKKLTLQLLYLCKYINI